MRQGSRQPRVGFGLREVMGQHDHRSKKANHHRQPDSRAQPQAGATRGGAGQAVKGRENPVGRITRFAAEPLNLYCSKHEPDKGEDDSREVRSREEGSPRENPAQSGKNSSRFASHRSRRMTGHRRCHDSSVLIGGVSSHA